jgi:hypothetical protein
MIRTIIVDFTPGLVSPRLGCCCAPNWVNKDLVSFTFVLLCYFNFISVCL